MPATVVVGAQWGDEGKGKVTDLLAATATAVARYQGGNNAGHTVRIGKDEYKLQLLPSGILRSGVLAAVGRGVVLDPAGLLKELDGLPPRRGTLMLDPACHVVLEHHRRLDAALDRKAGVGTTQRGIGPAYATKATRAGVRLHELLEDPQGSIQRLDETISPWIESLGEQPPDSAAVVAEARRWAPKLEPLLGDVAAALEERLDRVEHVVLEGAQGTLLDLDLGTYPYVTSSTTTAAGACSGTGLALRRITHVVAVAKAYTTRVGGGPFPTELSGPVADKIADTGREFGTVTGRRRRVGWLDLVALRYAARVNGFTHLALTKADVLSGLDVQVCTAYTIDGTETTRFPGSTGALARARPVLERLGTLEPPLERSKVLRDLVERVEATVAAPVSIVGTGPARDEFLQRGPLPPG